MSFIKSMWRGFSRTFGATVFHPQFFTFRYLYPDMKGAVEHASGTLLDIGCGVGAVHLALLKNKGIIEGKRDGAEVYYSVIHPLAQKIVDILTQ